MSKDFNRALQWLVMNSDCLYDDINYNNGVYIYGAGELGLLALQYCEACNIPILGFLDQMRDTPVPSASRISYPVFHPHSYAGKVDKSKCIAVAIATQPFHPIRNSLLELGWTEVVPFYHLTSTPSECHPLKNGWRLGSVNDEEIGLAREIFARWADDHSRQHYEAFLAWHRSYTEITLSDAPISVNDRYVIPEVVAALKGRTNQLVDIGAHVGESIRRMNAAAVTFSDYVVFEPDTSSCAALEPELAKLIPPGATSKIVPQVLDSCRQKVAFQSGLGYCSQIWTHGNICLDSYALDDFNLKPDFLKIHTEGKEAEILAGARETVKGSRPVIAYSVYHRREGFYNDIFSVMSAVLDYKWHFRLHSFQGTGAFVYGIPLSRERT
jgi:hypothetical protein